MVRCERNRNSLGLDPGWRRARVVVLAVAMLFATATGFAQDRLPAAQEAQAA